MSSSRELLNLHVILLRSIFLKNVIVSFEIYYTQLDLTSASATFPIFFKPKIQLKDYIKNELNL